jgi:hypothetical protein
MGYIVVMKISIWGRSLLLRKIWLECCGHLSTFEIDGVRYAIDAGMYDDSVEEHECGEEMLLSVVNSSRVGMGAYTG